MIFYEKSLSSRILVLPFLLILALTLASCAGSNLGRISDETQDPDIFGADSLRMKGANDSLIFLDQMGESFVESYDTLGISGDTTVAVDDYVWRELSFAQEYYAMGVQANRETAWEEAQYYFEKSLAILGELDIDAEADTLSPEAAKYNRLLAEIIVNYRSTLLSLGHLPGDVSADVLMARFSEINHLKVDSSEIVKLEQYAQEKVSFNVPVIFNDRVKKCLLYYQTVARDAFARYLSRSKVYGPMIDSVFREYGIPSDIKYLALIESGYNPHAYSWARAMGLWQFIASTGKLYDLNRTWWYDERKDPVKATVSAARFLKDLYEKFGSWELSLAAYNGGPGRVERQIAKQKTKDFWKLKFKRRETMDYVPFFMAGAMISKDPGRFGFENINYLPEWQYDLVKIDKCLDLKTVAKALGCGVAEIKELNPELLREFTPPNKEEYRLRIPKGAKNAFWAAYDEMASSKPTSFAKHKIRRGETIASIARKYGVSKYALLEANNMTSKSKIIAGKTLIVPVPSYGGNTRETKGEYAAEGNVYVVRNGDTVWDIARAFGTTPDSIRKLNSLGRNSQIYVGQKLRVRSDVAPAPPIPEPSPASNDSKICTVKKGDTLWDIARRYGATPEAIRKLNGLERQGSIYPGQQLVVRGNVPSDNDCEIYTIKRGDTLSNIASLFKTTVARLMDWNDLRDPRKLKVGDRIKIYTN